MRAGGDQIREYRIMSCLTLHRTSSQSQVSHEKHKSQSHTEKSRHTLLKVDSETDPSKQSLNVALLNSLTISYGHATSVNPIHPSLSSYFYVMMPYEDWRLPSWKKIISQISE